MSSLAPLHRSDTDLSAALARSGLRAAAGLLLAFAVLLALPLQAQTLTTLVSNTGETLDTGSTGSIVAQSVRTGPNADGYTISEVVIRLHAGSGSTSTSVSIRKNASGEPGDLVATLTNPSTLSRNSLNTFTAPVGTRLDASKTYWITVSEGISNRAPLSLTFSNAQTGAQGWRIGDNRLYRSSDTDDWTNSDSALVITIKGTAGTIASTDATLSDLTLADDDGNAISLTPTFVSATTDYMASVANGIDAVTLTAMTNDSNAMVAITSDDDTTSPGEAVLPLIVGSNTLTVTVTAEDGSTTETYTVAVTRGMPVPVDIEPNYDSIGAGLEDLVFTLTREGAATDELEATVTIVQEQIWLTAPNLSHTVTFAAGDDTATLTLAASLFSFDPDTSGDLTATVTGAGIAGDEATVTMISIADPAITVSYDMSSYTFAEDAAPEDVIINVEATLDSAYPRAPSRTFQVSFTSRSDTAISPGDYGPISWSPDFLHADYGSASGGGFVARKRLQHRDGTYFSVEDDDVYEGNERLVVNIDISPGFPYGLVQFAYSDGSTCEPHCSPTPEYPVTITDEEDRPVLSLSAEPASITEEDDDTTTSVTENVSTLTVAAASPKTFATEQTITLTFVGTADYGADYGVSPVDADANATGHQVLLPAETASVQVTVTATTNDTADGDRSILVTGSRDGTAFGTATITLLDDETTTAATGQPGISGTAAVGQTLTATTTDISDADGKTKAEDGDSGYAYTYQWILVDGNTEDDIPGETSSTYTPSSSDVGKTIKVRVSFTDDLDNAEGPFTSDQTAAVTVVTVDVSIAADHDRIGAGLEDLVFTLTREGAATDALEATVTIDQDQSWLTASNLSRTVTFAVGSATATLTLDADEFSFEPSVSGDLTATVSGTGIAGGEATVEVVSTADPAITISYDMSSYTFAEDATDVEIYVLATLDPAYPRAPSRSFFIAVSTKSDTATLDLDYVRVNVQAQFVHGDFAPDGNRYVARKRLQHSDGTYFGVENDDVYEGPEGLVVSIEQTSFLPPGLVQFARPNGDTCGPLSCSPNVEYPVTITDEEDRPVLSLAADPASITEEDDDTTTSVTENVSVLTVAAASPKTFATDQAITLTFAGTAVYGTHYSVNPADTDANATGHQVLLPAETASVEVTVTAATNDTADGHRSIAVTGSRDGTAFGTATTITLLDDETTTSTPAPELVGAEVPVSGDRLILTYDVDLDLGGRLPPAEAFTVEDDGDEVTVQSVAEGVGTNDFILNLLTAIGMGQTVTVSYTVPSTNAIRDLDGIEALPFTYEPVANNSEVQPNTDPVFDEDMVTFEIAENQPVGTNIGDPVVATDAEGDDLEYSLADTPYAGNFSIDAATGQLRSDSLLDFEAATVGRPNMLAISVVADDGRGGTAQATVVVNVTDVDEPPEAPAEPTVTPVAGSTTSLSVTWTEPSNKGPAIDGYDLRYRVETTSGWTDGPEGVSATTETLTGLAVGTSYKVQVRAINAEGDGVWSVEGTGRTTTTTNTPATGKPGISGTAAVGQTLTATTSGISDADGKTKAEVGDSGYAYTYQWILVDGNTETDISGETSSTYTPSSSDVGKTIRVKVSFTDDADNAESPFTSEAYPASGTIEVAAAGICGRTLAVRAAILNKISSVSDCANVTDTHLAAITGGLSLSNRNVTALAVGDFAGLDALTRLNLHDNALTTLPAGVFGGLDALTRLTLHDNALTTLPAGVFGGLDALTELKLYNNALTALPAGVFAGLDMLTTLSLSNSGLDALPDGVFAPLTALTTLYLTSNGLATLPAGVFAGLDALTKLRLDDNALIALPAGVFAGLDALTTLWLNDNALTALPAGVFAGLDMLTTLWLDDNALTALPDDVFEPLTALTELKLTNNSRESFAPEAVALPDDGTVSDEGGTVTLDGSGSGGAWGTNVTYGWALTEPASGVTFDDDTSVTPKVTVPSLPEDTELTFTLTVTGRGGTDGILPGTDTAKVRVTRADNTAPTASDSSVTTNEDTAHLFAASDFNFDDTDTGDTLASVTVVTLPTAGVLALNGTAVTAGDTVTKIQLDANQLTFMPAADGNGDAYASFTFRVSDGTDESAADYSMTVNVTAVNDVATGKPTIEGTAQAGKELTATTSGITDVDGNTKAENGDTGYAYTYQWVLVDGGAETDISGETSSTYTPSSSDVSKTIKVKVSFTDDLGSAEGPLTSDATVAVVTVAVSIAAEYASIGAGLEDLVFNLTREGAATDALEATVTIVQDQPWLGTSDLSHTVSFTAGSATATLTLGASRFSFDPETAGNLTATVAVAGVSSGEATVEMVSTADPAITISYDKSSYTFAEDATDVEIYVLATLDTAYPRAPSRSFQIALSTESDTAIFRQDFVSIIWAPQFVHGDYELDGNRFVARKRLQADDGAYFGVLDYDIYEGSERLFVNIDRGSGFVLGMTQFQNPDGTTCEPGSGCTPKYPVFITDEEDRPVLSLSAVPASIAEEDDDTTMNVAENVSVLTVAAASPKTFATEQTITLTFGGTAVYGVHYSVNPADADANTGGHQVLLPAETPSVQVTVTAAGNDTADGHRSILVTGSLDGTEFDRTSVAVADNETTTNTAATGQPMISGTAQVGQMLTATTSGITDVDGNTKAEDGDTGYAYTYQWVLVDGGAETDISGETSSTYTPSSSDVGKKVKVKVTFTDNGGTAETVTSDAYPSGVGTIVAVGDPVNADPVFNDGTSTTRSVAENTAAGTDIGAAVSATDADNDSLEYTLEGADLASFDIVLGTGQLQTKMGVDYNHEAAKNSYSVTVKADDGNGGTDTIAVTVNVTDVDEKAARPAKPTVTATPGTTDSLDVRWTKSDLAGGPEIIGYELQHRITGQGNWNTTTPPGTGTMSTIGGLTTGTEYSVQVRARNGETTSDWSEAGEGTPGATTAAGVTVSTTALAVAEEDTTGDSYTVVLDTRPTASVTVTVGGHSGTDVTPYPATLMFTVLNWDTARTVTVTAADDVDTANDTVLLTHSATSTDRNYRGIVIAEVTVTVNDNDTARVTVVTGVHLASGPGPDGVWRAGDTVEAVVEFSEAVTVDTSGGEPVLAIEFGAQRREAVYASGTGTAALVFHYVVAQADDGARAARVVAGGLSLNGATIRNAAGVDAVLGFVLAPAVTSVAVAPDPDGDGLWSPGEAVTVTVGFSDEVAVDTSGGTPSVAVLAGGGEREAVYSTGSGTATLRFAYTVLADDGAVTSVQAPANGLALNGGAIVGPTGLAAALAHAGASRTGTPAAPALSVADASVAEGGTLVFAVTLDRAAAAVVVVDWATGDGTARAGEDYAADSGKIAFVPGETLRTVRVAVLEDDEVEGAETMELTLSNATGAGLADATATGRVSDPAGEQPAVSVADAKVRESPGAVLAFKVTLDRVSRETATVDWETLNGGGKAGAKAGQDYVADAGTLVFVPGETAKTVNVAVLDDSHDEGQEVMLVVLSNAVRATIADGAAKGIIENSDHMPKAWLARFGRTVAEQVLDAVEDRLRSPPHAGVEARLVGEALPLWDGGSRPGGLDRPSFGEDAGDAAALTDWLRDDPDPWSGADSGDGRWLTLRSRAVTSRDFLTGTSFAMTKEAAGGAGLVSLWGRGALTRFDGRERGPNGDLTLEGEVGSAMLGADWTGGTGFRSDSGAGAWTAGLLLAHSRGEGSYRGEVDGNGGTEGTGDTGGTEGTVLSSVTGLYPYGRYRVTNRVTLWGVAGYGAGTLTLTPQDADGKAVAPLRTDMELMMAALGLRGVAVEAPAEGGFELAGTSDAMVVRTSSEKTSGLAAATGDVTRLRLGLEGVWRGLAFGGHELEPSLEVGIRHDGGDAETGFGADIGAGLAWSHANSGVSAEVSARGLLTHAAGGFREQGIAGSLTWDPRPETERGALLTLRQTMGAQASGGMDALLGHTTLAGLTANDDDELQNRRLELKLGYGFPVFSDRFTSTPEIELGLSDRARDYSLGWRLTLARRAAGTLELGGVATRREHANDKPRHAIGFRLTARW